MLFARRLKPLRKETERRTCYGTKAVLDARMVYQPGTQIPEGARLVHLKKGLIFNAIEEEATTTTEVVLAAEVGSVTTTTDAMIHIRDKEVGEEVEKDVEEQTVEEVEEELEEVERVFLIRYKFEVIRVHERIEPNTTFFFFAICG